jgi:2-keto-3-deoxy-L-rhamnonate aldolase RhmA
MPEERRWLLRNGRNIIVDMLAAGEPVLALGVRAARTLDIVRVARATGHHMIWFDLEHSTMSIDVCAQLCSACLDAGIVPFVRVPERDYGVIGRLLDGGAVGIMLARMESAEQVADFARACRFMPQGIRSQIVGLPLFNMRRVPAPHHNRLANRATVVMPLIETEAGCRNIEAIAALEGVDLIGSGSNDFSAELGDLGNYKHPTMTAGYTAAIKACKKHGKPFSVGGIGDMAQNKEWIKAGAAPLLFSALDSEFMRDALQEKVKSVLGSWR